MVKTHDRKDISEADEKRAVKEYGDVNFADSTNKKYPIDTPEHVRAAWSYIHMRRNRKYYTKEELRKIESAIRSAARKLGIELKEGGD